MVFEKRVVIDCRGHLLGRLASIIAKELLSGQRVVAVRCEEINLSGSHFRNKLKYKDFLRKRCQVNPTHGPIHFRAPGKVLWRTIRGMLPHKTPRGEAALAKLKVFEGIPPPFDKVKRKVAPEALRVTRLRPGRRYCTLGRLCVEMGWKHQEVVKKLEERRKVRSQAFYEKKKALLKARSKAKEDANKKVASVQSLLAKYGY